MLARTAAHAANAIDNSDMHTEADVIEDPNTWGLPAAQLMRAHVTATWDGPLRRRFWVPRDASFANLQAYLRGQYHESALVIGAEPLDLDTEAAAAVDDTACTVIDSEEKYAALLRAAGDRELRLRVKQIHPFNAPLPAPPGVAPTAFPARVAHGPPPPPGTLESRQAALERIKVFQGLKLT